MARGKGSKGKKRPPAKRPAGTAAKRPATPPSTGAPKGAPASGRPAAGAAPTPNAPPEPAPGTTVRTKPTRTERLEAARRARKRKALLTRVAIFGALAVLAGVVAVVVTSNRREANEERERLTAGSCTFDTRHDPISASPNNHVAPSSYRVDPPSGGNHSPQAAGGGVYGGDGRPAPPDGQLVHALEHGFVILWHRPDLAEQDLAAVRGVFDDFAEDVLVVPRPSLQGKVAATSWGKRLLCSDVEPQPLADFVRLYRNESPEPGVR